MTNFYTICMPSYTQILKAQFQFLLKFNFSKFFFLINKTKTKVTYTSYEKLDNPGKN